MRITTTTRKPPLALRPESHQRATRLMALAQSRAKTRLVQAHPDEYLRYRDEERRNLGL